MNEENNILPKDDLNNPDYYLSRELSMVSFQERVFEEAQDPNSPLLERVKFLAFVGLNLDEFFMVRVGGLKMQNDIGITKTSIDGRTPAEQLAEIRKSAGKLMNAARQHWAEDLLPSLASAGIHIHDYEELNTKQRENADEFFHEVVFPVLTPLAFDPGHPFPHISNLSLNLAVEIKDDNEQEHFARVKVPATLPRLVPIKRSSGSVRKDGTVPYNHYFVWLDQLIAANLNSLFPGMQIIECYPFHITRNADIEIQELEASDLLETMEESVRRRRFGDVVRLKVNINMPDHILNILIHNLRVDRNDTYKLDGPLGMSSLMELTKIDRFDLKDLPFLPKIPDLLRHDLKDGSIFSSIRRGESLLHHPYDSFDPIINFIQAAARDPNVLTIKQTLYRVGSNSPIVRALLEARRDYGKQVAVLLELKARFDEESNIRWAKRLENEGVHVIYGLLGLKTHAKVTLVVRKEGERLRRYVHIGTGNYNHTTAKSYEDLGILTCDEDIGTDATDLFNLLTGYSAQKEFRKLLIAPIHLRERLGELIQREIAHKKSGKDAHLIFKTNALVDKPMIKLLYKASQAGVKIDLIVRSMCSLVPGIQGLSENIRVVSVLGRFLEHSRIYYFKNNGMEEIYIGSADLMPRNLDNRVEVITPIESQKNIRYLRDIVLETYIKDNVKARIMHPEGTYFVPSLNGEEEQLESQAHLLKIRNG
ncbi:polyphosphate kinase 1 [Chloroflexota bacterium]